jgi:hypothetical protein
MPCRFEITMESDRYYPQGGYREIEVIASGDVDLVGEMQPYIKFYINTKELGEEGTQIDRIKDVLRSKEFYRRIRAALEMINRE